MSEVGAVPVVGLRRSKDNGSLGSYPRKRSACSSEDAALRNPITRIAGSCARDTRGRGRAAEQRHELTAPIKKLTAHETAAAALSSTEKPSSARRLTRRALASRAADDRSERPRDLQRTCRL